MATQPNVDIRFKDIGNAAIDKADRGIVYLILQDASVDSITEETYFDITEISENLSDENKVQIKLAMVGSYATPKRVSCIITPPTETFTIENNEALTLLSTTDCDYFAIPSIDETGAGEVATWLKQHNGSQPIHLMKAVLPNVEGNDEHVINVTQDKALMVDGTELVTNQLCGFVAGLRAACPMQFSLDRFVTNTLSWVPPVDMRKGQGGDNRVQAGEFFFNMDRGRVSVVADVNSLTELAGKDESYQQNKEVDIMDALYNGLKPSVLDKYIGKFTNSYQNKLILVSAIDAYLKEFEMAGLVEQGDTNCEIAFDEQRLYLKTINYRTLDDRKVEEMTKEEILKANTKDHVFLRIRFLPLGAIRHVDILVLT